MSDSFNTKSMEVEQLLNNLKSSTASSMAAAGVTGGKKTVFRSQKSAAQTQTAADVVQDGAKWGEASAPSGQSGVIDTDELLKAVVEAAGATAFVELGDALPDEERVRYEPPRSNRNILTALGALADDEGDAADDTINKSMLSHAIEQEKRNAVSHKNPVSGGGRKTVSDTRDNQIKDHKLFNTANTLEIPVIPGEAERGGRGGRGALSSTLTFDSDAVKREITVKADRKGVLNVQDNVDDNFREFFGNTVIIDKESLESKAKRRRTVKEFVMPDDPDEAVVPVFEDDEPEDAADGFREYTSDEDTEPLFKELLKYRTGYAVKTGLTCLFTVALLVINALSHFGMLPFVLANGVGFGVANAALLVLVLAVNAADIFPGLVRLVSFGADRCSLVSFVGVAALAECGAYIALRPDSMPGLSFSCVAACAVMFTTAGELLNSNRILSNFKIISGGREKYASLLLDNEQLAARLTRGLDVSSPRVLYKRRTGFTDGFLTHSFSESRSDKGCRTAASVFLIVCIGCGVAGYFFGGKDIFSAIRALAAAAALCAPFTAAVTETLPIYVMQKHLSKTGTVVPGYSAAQEVLSANSILLDGHEIFPNGNVKLHGIKTFDREPIDKAILYAASVLIRSCETMAPVFMRVIQNKTDMLFNVDDVQYENGLGYGFWVGSSRVFLGTRELMTAHEIPVPSREYEKKYTKSSNRDAVYLAVSGKLFAMFVISYSPNLEVRDAISGFVRDGVNIVVHTRDFNITAEKIAMVYRIPKELITVVRESEMRELGESMEYVAHSPSSITHIGSLTSFVNGVFACMRLRSSAKIASIIELVCLIFGGVVAVALAAMGTLSTLSVFAVLLFQLVWLVILCTVEAVYRY